MFLNARRHERCAGRSQASGTACKCRTLRGQPVGLALFVMASRYSKKASEKVEQAMHERKRGTLRSGRSGRKVKSRKQAIAIGLSQARRSGAKVPQRSGRTRAAKKK